MWFKSFIFLIVTLNFSVFATTSDLHQHFIGPTLEKLKVQISKGNMKAGEDFWGKIQKSGGPLFEKIPGNKNKDKEMYCTFLYLTENNMNIKNVFVLVSYLFPWRNLEQWMMEPLDLGSHKLWYKTIKVRADIRTEYRFAPNETLNSMEDIFSSEDYVASSMHWKLDPLNKEIFTFPKDEDEEKSQQYSVSVLVGPKAKPQSNVNKRLNIPNGHLKEYKFTSKILGKTKRVYVYTPPNYDKYKDSYHFLFSFDGFTYTRTVSTPTILDNLIEDKLISPMVAVFVDDLGGDNSRLEDLSPNEKYPEFLRQELLPWIRNQYTITSDPTKTFIAGSSLGGLGAVWNAFKSPDLFGNVLAQSGAYFWYPGFDEARENIKNDQIDTKDKLGWLIKEFQKSKLLPLHFYIDVGLLENGDPFGENSSNLIMSRQMCDALKAKGYPLKYVEYNGGHEYLWWQQTLADGLIALFKMRK